MKTLKEKMDLNITLAKITMLKEDITFHQGIVDEKRERLKELEWKFKKLQNQES